MRRFMLFLFALLPFLTWAQKPIRVIMGDPISHHLVYIEHDPIIPTLHRIYQATANKEKVRQVVVTKRKWTNAPDSILDGGGYRLEALSPHELEEYKECGKIWGELFGFRNMPADSVPDGQGEMQIEIYPLNRYSIYPRMALELMYFEAEGRRWLTAAPNRNPWYKEYNLDGDWRVQTPEQYHEDMESTK